MMDWFEIALLILLITTAVGVSRVKNLISAVLVLACYSFLMAAVWAQLGAVDVAFVEAVVGAGLATVLFLLTLFRARAQDTQIRRTRTPLVALLGLPLLGLLLLYAAVDLPPYPDGRDGQDLGKASTRVSAEYLQKSYQKTKTPNVVTAVLMDYRAFDTLIETGVIFTAGVACALLLRGHAK